MNEALRKILATVCLAAFVGTNAQAATSITYTVGNWQVTATTWDCFPEGRHRGGWQSITAAKYPGWRTTTVGHCTCQSGTQTPARLSVWPITLIFPAPRFPSNATTEVKWPAPNAYGGCGRLYRGVYWNSTGQAFGLPALAGTDSLFGPVHVMAHGINSLGQVVGGAQDGTSAHPMHAVLWQNRSTPPLDLGFLGKGTYVDFSEAFGINDLGHVVGNGALGTLTRGFLWRSGRMIDLGALSGQVVSEAKALNNNGLIVGKNNFYPVTGRYEIANSSSTPAIQQLPVPTGFFSAQPSAVNDSGDAVGHAGSPNIDAHAILWRNAIDLGIWPGGHYSVATGINNLGQIVGTGTVAGDNLDHALMWTVTAAGDGEVTPNKKPLASLQATSSTSIRRGGSVSVQASFADPDNGPWSTSWFGETGNRRWAMFRTPVQFQVLARKPTRSPAHSSPSSPSPTAREQPEARIRLQ